LYFGIWCSTGVDLSSKQQSYGDFVSIKQGEIVEDGCCSLQDNVFDEAKCVFCFVV